jgi:hypothetical protein
VKNRERTAPPLRDAPRGNLPALPAARRRLRPAWGLAPSGVPAPLSPVSRSAPR